MDPYEHQETKKGLTQVNLTFRSASFHYRKEVFYFCSFFLAAATVASYMIGVPIMMEA